MSQSVNGWNVLQPGSSLLHRWPVPEWDDDKPDRGFTLRRGSVGFLLVHLATWFHDEIERLDTGTWDEWGHAVRPITRTNLYSNHSSGTAVDLNATRHPYHVPVSRTFTKQQIERIRGRLRLYDDVIEWGGDWSPEWVDGMHFEIAPGTAMDDIEVVARRLMKSWRGKRILALSPGQEKVILS